MSQGVHVCVSMGLGYAMGAAAGSATSLFGPVTVRLVLAYVPLHLVCVKDIAAALLHGQAPAYPQWQPESYKSTPHLGNLQLHAEHLEPVLQRTSTSVT